MKNVATPGLSVFASAGSRYETTKWGAGRILTLLVGIVLLIVCGAFAAKGLSEMQSASQPASADKQASDLARQERELIIRRNAR